MPLASTQCWSCLYSVMGDYAACLYVFVAVDYAACLYVFVAVVLQPSQCILATGTGTCDGACTKHASPGNDHAETQGATYATSQTLVEFKDSALHSLDGTVDSVQARWPAD